ncbi:MAG: hypothetical protein ACRDHY_06140 [Anaerolineales bacterium]
MAEASVATTRDLVSVGSRVSWGAILAGAMVSIAIYFLLAVLGTAIGLTVSGNLGDQELGAGAAIYAILTTLISLFTGGWVVSQCAVGETKLEAAVHGTILWGLILSFMLWLMVSGIRIGFVAVVDTASMVRGAYSVAGLNELPTGGIESARGDVRIAQAAATGLTGELRAIGRDDKTVEAAWWAFGGLLLSVFAAILGAIAGSGPNVVFRRVLVSRSTTTVVPPAT